MSCISRDYIYLFWASLRNRRIPLSACIPGYIFLSEIKKARHALCTLRHRNQFYFVEFTCFGTVFSMAKGMVLMPYLFLFERKRYLKVRKVRKYHYIKEPFYGRYCGQSFYICDRGSVLRNNSRSDFNILHCLPIFLPGMVPLRNNLSVVERLRPRMYSTAKESRMSSNSFKSGAISGHLLSDVFYKSVLPVLTFNRCKLTFMTSQHRSKSMTAEIRPCCLIEDVISIQKH